MNHSAKNTATKADLIFHKAFIAHQAGKLEEAETSYRKALRKTPADMETLYLLGTVCSQLGKGDEAVRYLKKSLDIEPDHPEALNNLGLALTGLRKGKEAVTYYQRALALRPDYVDALNNLGSALEILEQLDEAESHLRQALQLNPDFANANYNLGLVLKGKDRFEEAVQFFLRGIELEPELADAYNDLSQIYKIWGRYEEALACVDHALALTPDSYSANNNRGATLEQLGRFDEALAAYERAAILGPEQTTARWNQAFLFLRQGILDRGWEAHELRLAAGGQVADRFPYPQWDGSSLENKTILIYAEQGLGDEILFASCFNDMIAKARHCVIECEPRLAPLFSRSFPAATIQGGVRTEIGWLTTMPQIDVQIAAGSLPRFFRPTLESFPDKPSYLFADPQRTEYWRSRLALLGPGLKVGICWRSSLAKGERNKLYSELTQWGEAFKIPGLHFVNLQYGECAEELQEAEARFGIAITAFPELDLRNEIDESAALTACMDLVISASTAVCEMAGALGVASYRIDPYGALWDTLGCSDRIPWHPSTRLFAQPSPGDWDTPLALMGEALKDRVLGTASSVEFVRLPHGVEIAVSSSLDDLPTYVLNEQRGWFDPEYEFILGTAQPGMRIMDVGAGAGAYAIPLAQKIADGRLWAFTQTAAEINLLMQSRIRNQLEKNVDIAIAGQNLSLDAEMDMHGLDDIALLRVAAGLSNPDLIAGSTRFLSANSPLIMFGIRPGESAGMEMANRLMKHGYGLYRLVPGLGLLVPFVSAGELDAFALNLFACKPDRAELLEQRGILIRQLHLLDNLPGIDLEYWQEYLQAMPYAKNRLDRWVNAPQQEQDWEVNWMALNLFAMAKSASHSASLRYACMQAAGDVMVTLVQEHANIPRLLSLCRMLTELGKREAAVGLLNQICSLLDSGVTLPLDEPFLALTDAHTLTEPGDRLPEWLVAMILQQREWLRAFSSFFTGQESLPVLEEIQASGFGDEAVGRRIMLIRKRFGASLSTERTLH